VLILLLLLALGLPAVAPTPLVAQRPNGAGLVIRHGDGQVVISYIEFTEPEITGLELLMRSGASVTLASFGSLGVAVCAIGSEGCPADDCFCKSYSSPAFYWHYYSLQEDGSWVLHPVGPSSRRVRDGDVDGWAWTSGDSGLPQTSIEDIAARFGVQRSPETGLHAPVTTPTEIPSVPPASTASSTPGPSPESTSAQVATLDSTPVAQLTAAPSPQSRTPQAVQPSTSERNSSAPASSSSPPPPTPVLAMPTSAGTSSPAASGPPDPSGYLAFAFMLALVLVLVVWLTWRGSLGTRGRPRR
jgi:hypothetical protein